MYIYIYIFFFNVTSHLIFTRDRVSNIDVIAYETADNVKSLLEAWNMNTNKW